MKTAISKSQFKKIYKETVGKRARRSHQEGKKRSVLYSLLSHCGCQAKQACLHIPAQAAGCCLQISQCFLANHNFLAVRLHLIPRSPTWEGSLINGNCSWEQAVVYLMSCLAGAILVCTSLSLSRCLVLFQGSL